MEATGPGTTHRCVETSNKAEEDRAARGDVVWWLDGADAGKPLLSAAKQAKLIMAYETMKKFVKRAGP